MAEPTIVPHDLADESSAQAAPPVTSALRKLLVFAAPVGASGILYPLSGALTSIWVGRYLGEDAFAASVSVYLVLALVLALLVGIATATGVLLAQRLGAGDAQATARVVRSAVPIHLLATMACCTLGWIGAADLLRLMGLAEHQLEFAVPYFRLQLAALLPISILQLANALLRSGGDSQTGFKATSLALAIGGVLTPLLIFGPGALPALGLSGAALAELLAYTITLVLLLVRLYRRNHQLVVAVTKGTAPLDLACVRWILSRGLSMGLQSIVTTLSALGVTLLTNRHGSHVTAAFGAAGQLWAIMQIPAFAISIAVTNHVAQAIGARDHRAARAYVYAGMKLAVLALGPLILFGYLFAEVALSVFLPDGSSSLELAVRVNSIVLWSYGLYGVGLVLLGVCRAAGAVIAPLLITAISLVGIRFAIMYGGASSDIATIAWSVSLSMTACMILSAWYFRARHWKEGPA